MNLEDILGRVQDIARDQLDDDSIELAMDMKANDVPGWDSLAHVRIVIAAEKEFGASFDTSEIVDLQNIGSLVELIASKTQAA
jgi:acyl carrier protein